MPAKLEMVATKNCLVTIRYLGKLIHSLYDPVAEAERMILPLLSTRPTLVLIFGLGLAYHVKALREKLKEAKILVYEPYEEIYQAAVNYRYGDWQEDEGIHVFHNAEELEDFVIQRCIYGGQVPLPSYWVHPSYHRLAPGQVVHIEAALRQLRIRQATNRKTLQEKTQLWLENIQTNWTRLLTIPSFCQLIQAFRQIPCAIVGAGPSLQKNYHFLEEFRGKGLLFVSGSVYAWLKGKGIRPDMVGVSEGGDESTQLTAHREEDEEWVAVASSSHPNHFASPGGRHFSFHQEKWVAQILEQEPFIPHGGHVCSAAFTMALLMGCNPIILVGQDLSHGLHQLHVDGVKDLRYEEEVLRSHRFLMKGQDGMVYGHSAMVSYLSWYEESARYLARVRPDLRLINSTEGGVRIRGFEEKSLQKTCEECCRKEVRIHPILRLRLSYPPVDQEPRKRRLVHILYELQAMEEQKKSSLTDSLAWQLYNWLQDGREACRKPDQSAMAPPIVKQGREVIQSLIDHTESSEKPCH